MSTIFKVGSLFAGIGGICLGFKQAKLADEAEYELLWANEIDEYACETYRHNFSHNLIEGDINKVLFPELAGENDKFDKSYYTQMKSNLLAHRIDVLTAGFPCQAFSIAGERKGFSDERGNLFWCIVNLVKQLDSIHGKPRVLFLENVKNLKGHDKGRTYSVIKSEIEKLGYIVKEHVLNTMDFSYLPQNRERIYIVCFLDSDDARRFAFFENLDEYQVRLNKKERIETIKEIIDYSDFIDDRYYYTKHKYPRYFLSQGEYEQIPEKERKDVRVNLDEQINEMYEFYQVRRGMYVRKNKKGVCPTLTANMGTGGHNVPLIRNHKGVRKLTPAETLRLQGFPVNRGFTMPQTYQGRRFADSLLYKQAGNAVSVPIVQLLATELLKTLVCNDSHKDVDFQESKQKYLVF